VPGDCAFDLRRFVDTIRGRGWQGPLSVEVLSSELRGQPPEQVCRRLYQATLPLATPAGASHADLPPR
jgi:hypothetical protein